MGENSDGSIQVKAITLSKLRVSTLVGNTIVSRITAMQVCKMRIVDYSVSPYLAPVF